jgi:hypothetical protein
VNHVRQILGRAVSRGDANRRRETPLVAVAGHAVHSGSACLIMLGTYLGLIVAPVEVGGAEGLVVGVMSVFAVTWLAGALVLLLAVFGDDVVAFRATTGKWSCHRYSEVTHVERAPANLPSLILRFGGRDKGVVTAHQGSVAQFERIVRERLPPDTDTTAARSRRVRREQERRRRSKRNRGRES